MKFKLSKDLTPDQQTQLNTWKENLRKAVSATERHEKTHNNFCSKMEELRERHTKLEARAAAGDEDASIKLHGIMDQKMRLKVSIDSAAAESHDDAERLRVVVNNCQQGIGFAIRDIQDQIEDAVEEALAPFFATRNQARWACRDNHMVRALGQYFNAPLGQHVHELLPLARNFAQVIDSILAGEVVWEYAGAAAVEKPAKPAAKSPAKVAA